MDRPALPTLPHEILVHISTYTGDNSLLSQLMLHRPFYEYYTTCRQYILQLHTRILTDIYVTELYTIFGKLHRENGPAVIYSDGTQEWHLNDKLHREDGPAVEDLRCFAPANIYPNGEQHWYLNGDLHRDDGPAIIYADGSQVWYRRGDLVGRHP